MARYSSMGPRHFARLFRAEIGVNPAKGVERLRLKAALKRRNSA
jgi:transcriptional regulator GlxA family with amidase domain